MWSGRSALTGLHELTSSFALGLHHGKVLHDLILPEWQYAAFDGIDQREFDLGLTGAALREAGVFFQSRLVHEAMLMVVDAVNTRLWNLVPRFIN